MSKRNLNFFLKFNKTKTYLQMNEHQSASAKQTECIVHNNIYVFTQN